MILNLRNLHLIVYVIQSMGIQFLSLLLSVMFNPPPKEKRLFVFQGLTHVISLHIVF